MFSKNLGSTFVLSLLWSSSATGQQPIRVDGMLKATPRVELVVLAPLQQQTRDGAGTLEIQADEQGRFLAELAPGTYVLQPFPPCAALRTLAWNGADKGVTLIHSSVPLQWQSSAGTFGSIQILDVVPLFRSVTSFFQTAFISLNPFSVFRLDHVSNPWLANFLDSRLSDVFGRGFGGGISNLPGGLGNGLGGISSGLRGFPSSGPLTGTNNGQNERDRRTIPAPKTRGGVVLTADIGCEESK